MIRFQILSLLLTATPAPAPITQPKDGQLMVCVKTGKDEVTCWDYGEFHKAARANRRAAEEAENRKTGTWDL